jgi:hypothetical protein
MSWSWETREEEAARARVRVYGRTGALVLERGIFIESWYCGLIMIEANR